MTPPPVAGRRFSFFDGPRPGAADLPVAFYPLYLEKARHVHVAAQALGAFKHARRLGVTTSTDIHSWDGSDEYGLEYVREADLVFLSAAGAGAVPGSIYCGLMIG